MSDDLQNELIVTINRGDKGTRSIAAALLRRVASPASVLDQDLASSPIKAVETRFELVVYSFEDGEHFAQLESLLVQLLSPELKVTIATRAKGDADAKKITTLVDAMRLSSCSFVDFKSRMFKRKDEDTLFDVAKLLQLPQNDSSASQPLELHPIGSILCSAPLKKGRTALGALVEHANLLNHLEVDTDTCPNDDTVEFRKTFSLKMGNLTEHVRLDLAATKALNLFPDANEGFGGSTSTRSSLYALLNRCQTKMGSRLLRRWIRQPLTDLDEIKKRQDIVEFFADKAVDLRDMLRQEILVRFPDLEDLLIKLGGREITLKDIYLIFRFAQDLPSMVETFTAEEHQEYLDEIGENHFFYHQFPESAETIIGAPSRLCQTRNRGH